jgi:protein involved in ribonucleotide reduction
MQLGPSLHPDNRDVRRMATEDSHHVDEPFLLIFCTGRIVTARVKQVPPDTPDFPAYSQMYYRAVAGAGGSSLPTLGPL